MIKFIKRGTSNLRDADLSVLVKHILEKMTGNTNFTTPTPTLAVITTALADYETALAEAKTRDKDKVLVKNLRKGKLKDKIHQLFDYVNLTGGTDIEVLDSSGFPLVKERTPVGDMPKPEGLKVTLGDGEGIVSVRIKKVSGAESYVYQYIISPSPEVENWSVVNDPSSRILLKGLEPGTQYKFRVAAVGANGQGPWSDVITRYVA